MSFLFCNLYNEKMLFYSLIDQWHPDEHEAKLIFNKAWPTGPILTESSTPRSDLTVILSSFEMATIPRRFIRYSREFKNIPWKENIGSNMCKSWFESLFQATVTSLRLLISKMFTFKSGDWQKNLCFKHFRP